jgi:hypothetical protein
VRQTCDELETWLPGPGEDETPVTIGEPSPIAWEDNRINQ